MNTKHIEDSLAKIRTIFEKASERIDALKPGEKIPATKLAKDLGAEFNIAGETLYPSLKFLFDGYPGIEIRRGAHGGLVKLAPVVPVTTVAQPLTTDVHVTEPVAAE